MASRTVSKVLDGKSPKLHIDVKGLSRSALPTDLRRLCGRVGIENVSHVAINYKRFRPTGTATLSFPRPEYVPHALKALGKASLGGKSLTAESVDGMSSTAQRTRGSKGVLEAAQRGVITGDGPDAGITGRGRNVVLYGLPAQILPTTLSDNLRNFKLAGTEWGQPVIVKLKGDNFTTSARFLVRLSSVSEAYRMVRTLHMQKWRPDLHGDQFVVRAAVVS